MSNYASSRLPRMDLWTRKPTRPAGFPCHKTTCIVIRARRVIGLLVIIAAIWDVSVIADSAICRATERIGAVEEVAAIGRVTAD